MDKKWFVVAGILLILFASIVIAASYTADATFEYIPAEKPPVIEPPVEVPGPDESPVCPLGPDNSKPECPAGCEQGSVMEESVNPTSGVKTVQCVPQPIGKSVVYYIKGINKSIVENKLGIGTPTAGKVTTSTKNEPIKTGGCENSVNTCIAGVVAKSNNVDIVVYEGAEVDFPNDDYKGQEVFVASLSTPYNNQEFWVDLSGFEETLPINQNNKQKYSHRKYIFKTIAYSKESESVDYFRFIHFEGRTEGGETTVGLPDGYKGVLDCTLPLKSDAWKNYLTTTWAKIKDQSAWDSAKDLFFGVLGYKVGGAVGGAAYKGASAVASKGIGKVATLIPFLKTGTKVILKRANLIALTGVILSETSRKGAASSLTEDLKWYDMEKWFPTIISKNLNLDLFNSSTNPCVEETINNFDLRGPDIEFIFISGQLPKKEGDTVKIYFQIKPANVVNFNPNPFDGKETTYYGILPKDLPK